MTKEELRALRRERGKQELNIGDRVKVYDRNGSLMYGGKTAIIIEKALLDPVEYYYGLYVEGETVDKFPGGSFVGANQTEGKIGKTALLAPFFPEDLELVKEPTEEFVVTYEHPALKAAGKRLEPMFFIPAPTPIGYLEHEPTTRQISVYSKIGWFKRLMLKWCFGLRYVKRD